MNALCTWFVPAFLLAVTSAAQIPTPNGELPLKGGPASTRLISLTGTVASADGSSLPPGATVVMTCGTEERARTTSGGKGDFSLTISITDSESGVPPGQNSEALVPWSWADCEVYGDVPGYSSEHIHLGGRPDGIMNQLGTVVLHPLSPAQGFTVSVTSLRAPEQAKKALEKGQEQARKGKWSAAIQYFQRAVSVYPRYALAWVELGRVQAKQNNFAEAQQSFQKAVTEDSQFLEGYSELARLAAGQNRWKDVADATDHIVQSAPDASPQPWFLNAAANYNLGNYKKAESSVLRSIQLDPKHRLAQSEYLYGLILASNHDFKSAAEHVTAYLRLAPGAQDASQARAQLAEYQRLAQAPESASR